MTMDAEHNETTPTIPFDLWRAPQYGNPAFSRIVLGFPKKEPRPRLGSCSGNLISCGDLEGTQAVMQFAFQILSF